jgi:hypothetical protein
MRMLISFGRSPTINIKSIHYPERLFYSDYTENTLPEIVLHNFAPVTQSEQKTMRALTSL